MKLQPSFFGLIFDITGPILRSIMHKLQGQKMHSQSASAIEIGSPNLKCKHLWATKAVVLCVVCLHFFGEILLSILDALSLPMSISPCYSLGWALCLYKPTNLKKKLAWPFDTTYFQKPRKQYSSRCYMCPQFGKRDYYVQHTHPSYLHNRDHLLLHEASKHHHHPLQYCSINSTSKWCKKSSSLHQFDPMVNNSLKTA